MKRPTPPEILNASDYPKPIKKMSTIINGKELKLTLDPTEKDPESGSQWRNGKIEIEGKFISFGGGWIASEALANQENEAAGIAGGMRQGVSYPNETNEGDYIPYSFGEDESGWENEVMPILYGEDWEEMEEAREIQESVFQSIQKELKSLA